MKLRLIPLLACLVCCSTAADAASTQARIACWVPVRLSWPPTPTPAAAQWREESWEALKRYVSDNFRAQINAAGPDQPIGPFGGVKLDRSYLVFAMTPACERAIPMVRELVSRFALSIKARPELVRFGPTLSVGTRGVTKYQGFCGLEATAKTCPEADRDYPY
jgi:hypothetical protein